MNRTELIALVKSGKTVTVALDNASVVSIRRELRPINHYRCASMYKVVVKDPTFGAIYFSTFSAKFDDVNYGDTISLKVNVTGVGDATERYPDPILFSRANTRKGDSLSIAKPAMIENDLTVNV